MLACATLAIVATVLIWARQVFGADPDARFALDSDEAVIVSQADWITFRPRDADPVTGLIFYPGGKCEPAAYAPLLKTLAAQGFLVVLTPMPLNVAMLAPERATRVMARYPEIERWVVGGHSLGGVVAAQFAQDHDVAGLVLWASYVWRSDLSSSRLPVLSVFGTADTGSTPADIRQAGDRLPADTRYVAVAGADHWSFGDFAPGRGAASAARDQQQAEILQVTREFLEARAVATKPPGTSAPRTGAGGR